MKDSLQLEIAEIRLRISSSEEILPPEPQAFYQTFLRTSRLRSRATEVPITIQAGNMPDSSHLRKVFDGGSWWMGSAGNHLLFSLGTQGSSRQPAYIARFDRSVSKVMVYCSQRFVVKGPGMPRLINPVSYPLDQILLMYALVGKQGMIVHAAAIERDGKGVIFAGPSGSGKSTLLQLLDASGDFGLLSDDRIIVRKKKGQFNAYGTPWPGDLGVANNKKVTLSGIFFIHPGSTHRIQKIEPRDALEKLLPVTSIPWYDRTLVPRLLTLCEHLVDRVPAYDLYFKRDVDVGTVLKRFISV